MRHILAPVFVLTALILAPISVSAQQTETFVSGQNLAWLGIQHETEFSIRVIDGVKGGCWTNVEAVKNAVAIELQRSGYSVDISGKNIFGSEILLYANGYKTANFCVLNYGLTLKSLGVSSWTSDTKHAAHSLYVAQLWDISGVRSGPTNGMNSKIKEGFVELTQQLLLEIPKARREVLKALREAAAKNKDAEPEAYRYWMQFPD